MLSSPKEGLGKEITTIFCCIEYSMPLSTSDFNRLTLILIDYVKIM